MMLSLVSQSIILNTNIWNTITYTCGPLAFVLEAGKTIKSYHWNDMPNWMFFILTGIAAIMITCIISSYTQVWFNVDNSSTFKQNVLVLWLSSYSWLMILLTCMKELNHRSLFTLHCALQEQAQELEQDATFKQYVYTLAPHLHKLTIECVIVLILRIFVCFMYNTLHFVQVSPCYVN